MGIFRAKEPPAPVDISTLPKDCEFCGAPNGYLMLEGVRVFGCGNDHSAYLAAMGPAPRKKFLGIF